MAHVLELGPVTRPIGSYGLLLLAGLLVSGGLVVRAAHRSRQDVGAAIAAVGSAIGGGLFGSYALHCLVEWGRSGDPSAGLAGGLVFYGAVPGALLGGVAMARALGLRWLLILDLSVPALALAHALGRAGCFLGGCCYGRPADLPWAVRYPSPRDPLLALPLPRHPAPLYEALGLLLIALGFSLTRPRAPGSGRRALLYLAAYGCLRLLVESFRGDPERGSLLGELLSTSELLSVVALGIALPWLVWLAWRGRRAATNPLRPRG